jgi:uncharacterized damage-inducible protein DinB
MNALPSVSTSASLAATALADCLADLASVLERVSDLDYVATPPGGVSGTIGAHVRHCLDHVNAVLDPPPDGVVRYDGRRRQATLESDRRVAAAALRESAARLEALVQERADAPLVLESQVDRRGACVQVLSSLARELVFVLQHTIHHQALVALLLAGRGVAVPHTFGYAPSTPRTAA